MGRKNSGIIVELTDGRIGHIYNRDRHIVINGKVPVYTYDTIRQKDLFDEKADLSELNTIGKKMMCDPKTLKHIGMFDG